MRNTLRWPLLVVTLFSSMVVGAALPAGGQGRGRSASPLPDGAGKDAVQTTCSTCHAASLVINSGGYTRQGWEDLFSTMVALPKSQATLIADYLAKNFPEQPRPAAVVIPGSATVSFKEWTAPTLGSRPHDPEPGPDGTMWWSGQFASVLGRLDPKTGAMKEYPTRAAVGRTVTNSNASGNLWFTANFKGYIGKFNPKTGEFTEYPTGDPEARDPHTPLFDQKGILWYTLQGANMVGRLDPKTGAMKVVTVQTPKSNPYGMVVTTKGIPFFVEFGANKIASIDPETMAIHEYVLPHAETRPRRVAIDRDDVLWYGDYARGYLGRFDPKTEKATEWPSPGGPKSQPYGIAVLNGVIWYSESAVRPNTLVRFDPKTEKFQTWIIPGGGGVVRNMKVTADGNLALAESGVNKIALVEVKR